MILVVRLWQRSAEHHTPADNELDHKWPGWIRKPKKRSRFSWAGSPMRPNPNRIPTPGDHPVQDLETRPEGIGVVSRAIASNVVTCLQP